MKYFLLRTIFISCAVLSFTCVAHAQTDSIGSAVDAAQANVNAINNSNSTNAANGHPTSLNNLPSADDTTYDGIMSHLMGLFAWLVGVAAITLDNAVYYTVVHMGAFTGLGTGTNTGIASIGVAWRILRDIGNIVLIFGFLAAGIATILDVDLYGFGTKMLPKLLIAAVFLNFSLFISGAVISAGNLFATQFYTQINGGNPAAPVNYTALTLHNEGISNKIMAQLGLQTIYNVNFSQNKLIFQAGNMWIVGFMGILLFLVTAFVLFSLAFILIARFVALIFIIIVAPIGFAGFAVPKLEGIAKQWWSLLFEQTITAPVLLLMLYVALAVITDSQFLTSFGAGASAGGADAWVAFLNGGQGVSALAGVLLSFIIAMGLLLTVIVLSKRMSAFGAGWATNIGGKLSFGATAWAGRLSLGSAGNALTSQRMLAAARNNYVARTGVFAGRGLRNFTYDARNLPGGSILGAGKGSSMTPKQIAEKQYGIAPVQKWFADAKQEYEDAGKVVDLNRDLKSGNADAIARRLSKMSPKEVEKLDGIKSGEDTLVQNLSPQQFESLLKSDKLSESEKSKIKVSRYKPLGEAIAEATATGNPDKIEKSLERLSKGELEAMPAEMLADRNVLDKLTDKQRETIADSKERTAAEKQIVKNASTIEQLKADFANPTLGPASVAVRMGSLRPSQVAKLPANMLTSPTIAWKLTPAMLIALQEEKKLKASDITAIKNHIVRGGLSASQTYVMTGPGAALWS